jgi:hypothetical protein
LSFFQKNISGYTVDNATETDKRMNIPATFDRTTFRERGHFSNHVTINPVLRLIFDSTSVTVVRRFGTTTHPYSALSTKILKTYTYKPYGGGAGSHIPQTLVTVRGKGISFSFDLSYQFPDFKNGKEIISLIEQYMPIIEETLSLNEVKRKKNKIGIVVLIVLFALFLVLHLLGFW